MIIKTKFKPGSRVGWWFKGDYLTGSVARIEIQVDNLETKVNYWVECDKVIKSSTSFYLSESELEALNIEEVS